MNFNVLLTAFLKRQLVFIYVHIHAPDSTHKVCTTNTFAHKEIIENKESFLMRFNKLFVFNFR